MDAHGSQDHYVEAAKGLEEPKHNTWLNPFLLE